MSPRILPGAVHALLFAAKENEANGSPRHQPVALIGGHFNDSGRIAAIIERACAEIPRNRGELRE